MRVKTVREGISSRRFTPCKTDFEQKTETDCFAVYLTSRLVDNLPLLSYIIGKFQGSVCFESVHCAVEPKMRRLNARLRESARLEDSLVLVQ